MQTLKRVPAPIAETTALNKRYYRPELDILRFVAFFLVFASHAVAVDSRSSHFAVAFQTTGALGVPIFFMLSAFLITELLLREKTASGSINISAFYVRRALRIWPLYFFALLACYVLARILPDLRPMPVSAIASYLLFVGNWCAIFGPQLPQGFSHLWSISVEEQFYLVWPAVLLFVNTKTVAKVVVAAWAISQVAVMILCARHLVMWPNIWANSFTQLQYFAIGAFISIVFAGAVPKLSMLQRGTMAAGGLAILFIANFIFDTDMPRLVSTISRTFPGYLITGLGAALILLSLLGIRVKPKFERFVWLGKVSYGLYIYHVPCLVFVSALAAKALFRTHHHVTPLTSDVVSFGLGLPLTILFAGLSYKYFESAFLRLKERFEPRIPVSSVEQLAPAAPGGAAVAHTSGR